MKRFILVRHASTDANKSGVICGKTDVDLSEKGIQEAEKLSDILKRFSFAVVYTSGYKRANRTVNIALGDVEFIEKEGFAETDFGVFDMMTYHDIEKEYPDEYIKIVEEGIEYRFPDGESIEDTFKRVASEIDDIMKDDRYENVLICAHGGSIRCIISYLMDNDYRTHWRYRVDNASVSGIDVDCGFAVLNCLNVR